MDEDGRDIDDSRYQMGLYPRVCAAIYLADVLRDNGIYARPWFATKGAKLEGSTFLESIRDEDIEFDWIITFANSLNPPKKKAPRTDGSIKSRL